MDWLLWEKLDRLNEEQSKVIVDGITIDVVDTDINVRATTYVYIDLTRDGKIFVSYRLGHTDILDNAEFEWEPDGEPTYVPYGEQDVLYDTGEGGVESVNVGTLEPDEEVYQLDENDVDRATVLQVLGLTEEQLNKIEAIATKLAGTYLKKYVEEYLVDEPMYWPDRKSEDDRDWSDWEPEEPDWKD